MHVYRFKKKERGYSVQLHIFFMYLQRGWLFQNFILCSDVHWDCKFQIINLPKKMTIRNFVKKFEENCIITNKLWSTRNIERILQIFERILQFLKFLFFRQDVNLLATYIFHHYQKTIYLLAILFLYISVFNYLIFETNNFVWI